MREASLSRKRALADPTGSPGARTASGALAGLILEQEGRVFVPDSVSHWLQAAWGEEGGDSHWPGAVVRRAAVSY